MKFLVLVPLGLFITTLFSLGLKNHYNRVADFEEVESKRNSAIWKASFISDILSLFSCSLQYSLLF